MAEPIRIALIGGGLFARDAHIPSIKSQGDLYKIVAIYSRTAETAAERASEIPYPVDVTTDLPGLLAREDIEAVDVLLPIDVMAPVLDMALKSGKHVISEKPIAGDVATGRALITAHTSGSVWMVAENWRYEDTFVRAAQLLQQGEIGRPVMATLAIHLPISPKYYATVWRRSGSFPGGFLMDGGVHHVAGLRLVMGEIARVSASTALMRPDLLPADTLCAHLEFESGLIASYSVTYGSSAFWTSGLVICGEKGYMRVWRDTITIEVDGQTQTIPSSGIGTVDAELTAFAAAIHHNEEHRNTPQEALRDVAVVEAMLRSAESRQSITPEKIT